MPRTKSIAARRHRKIKAQVKGFKQARRTRVKAAKEAILHKKQYEYIGRRRRKRNLRSLWIVRMSAAAKQLGISYSVLIKKLKAAKIELDRKILSDIAVKDPSTFEKILGKLK